ncbi:hypothetical protein BN7_2858 [Wickerhamomyces ciferrii]|uniref:Uncharacterized protein n=1 Tax=Wickerhamomyces ciferrii (strain ATCC 14091 / BCRC 22168 / CBS 111 / JCM 3599 / NBRC 0793 / NRRL Y-1031 F-60-10) TaxID=1206466 RepID=K0KDZ6_WICCF|nr:uncharacterized protein BN7_2858 [Wickerhamomyces ciferrii]CCH43310.1 hypothetical protein BN7_2858 [Wickerhamomyces ciferrii]
MDYWQRRERETKLYRFIELIVKVIPAVYIAIVFHLMGLKECDPPEPIGIVYSVRYEIEVRLHYAIKKFLWKTQKAGYYIRFKSSKGCNFFAKHYKRAQKSLLSFLNKLIKTYKGKPDISSNKELCFPSEIWLKIVQYGVNPGNMIRVNKRLFNLFSPMVYHSFHLDLVLSSTSLLQKQYSHYLDFAELYYLHPQDPYKLYENYQKSKGAKYEFLDTYHRRFPNESYYTSNCELSSGAVVTIKTKVFRSFKDVERFLSQTITNENSYFRHFVQELSSNITIIDDFNELIEDCFMFGETISKLSKNEALNVLSCNAKSFQVFDFLTEEYEDCIRKNIEPPLFKESLIDLVSTSYLPFKDILPENPYFREMTLAGILFDDLQEGKQRRRLHNIKTNGELENCNPFKIWDSVSKPKGNLFAKKESILKGPGTVQVHGRHFFTEEETQNFLSQFVRSVTEFESHRNFKSSILISGVTQIFDISQTQEDQNSIAVPYEVVPQIILINRSI